MRIPRFATASLVLTVAVCGRAPAASPYVYLETFENDVDTTGGLTPPVGWWSSGGSLEEVPDGFDNVAVGPHGGAHFGQVYGNNTGYPVPSSAALGPPERASYQVDFYADPSRRIANRSTSIRC